MRNVRIIFFVNTRFAGYTISTIMELLGKIFNNANRVKIMRLFLFSDGAPLTIDLVSDRSQVRKDSTRKELNSLTKIGLLLKKEFTEKVATKPTKKQPEGGFKKVKQKGWMLNPKFILIEPLKSLLIDTELINSKEIVRRIRKAGNISMLVLSGLFVRDEGRKIDMLVVGDKVDEKILSRQISVIESEIGKELSYAFFSTEEFQYRMGMYDKLLRDVLENTHTTLVNKILL